jgi:hypothetical protein
MVPEKHMAEVPTYQLKVTLEDSRPSIWRRLQVPGDVTLAQLHDIIQAAMGWLDYHLHQFMVGEALYGQPDPDFGISAEMKDEQDVRLGEIARAAGQRFRYEYDFGDSWLHEVLVERIQPVPSGQPCPVCIGGQGACPPEDVGGTWGYEEFLEAIADREHPQHEDYLEWIGDEFDPEAFDMDEVNATLRSL